MYADWNQRINTVSGTLSDAASGRVVSGSVFAEESMDSRAPTHPGKSWNCVCKISRIGKVLGNEFGPGKSWKCKYKSPRSPGICWAMMRTQTRMPEYALPYTYTLAHLGIAAVVYSAYDRVLENASGALKFCSSRESVNPGRVLGMTNMPMFTVCRAIVV